MKFLRIVNQGFSIRLIIISLICNVSLLSSAQELRPDETERRNSLGFGFGLLPKHHDETFIPAIELSYMYDLSQRFAVGIGTGIHFTKEPFYVIAARGDMGIYKGFGIGALIGSAIQEGETSVMAGIELGYEFELKRISLSPFFELSYHHNHEHVMFGVQLAYPF
jgi:hypothetical protein